MSAAAAAPADGVAGETKGGGGRKKLLLLAIPLVLVAVGAGLWFGGILPPLLGLGKPAEAAADPHGAKPEPVKADAHGAKPDTAPVDAHGAKTPNPRGKEGAAGNAPRVPGAPIFAELPDIIANLNGGPRRTVYVKLRARLELAKPEDEALVQAAMPRLLDLFQTYLREMRPEELRSSAGTYRLREELMARANIALAPARAQDLLFTEILIQ
jgi:flagellar FliL protein